MKVRKGKPEKQSEARIPLLFHEVVERAINLLGIGNSIEEKKTIIFKILYQGVALEGAGGDYPSPNDLSRIMHH